MLTQLFAQAKIPANRPILVHARLRGLQLQSALSYRQLSEKLLHHLLACQPELLLIPAYTIYSFLWGRVFQCDLSHSEVGRFSEELRQQGYTRTHDPMYSMLDILASLPLGLDYTATFGAGTLFDYLASHNTIIVNFDMPGFYATPIHQLELAAKVPYRQLQQINGHMQIDARPWQEVNYQAYLRQVDHSGAAFPPYNQQRRANYLTQLGILHTTTHNGLSLSWANLDEFNLALANKLRQEPSFLVN